MGNIKKKKKPKNQKNLKNAIIFLIIYLAVNIINDGRTDKMDKTKRCLNFSYITQ